MTTEALGHALKMRFEAFKEFKINVTWKSKPGPNGVPKSLPTGWIQFKVCHTTRAWSDTSGKRLHLTIFFQTVFEAAYALDVAKEQGFAIGKRPVRIDRADGKSKFFSKNIGEKSS